MHRKTIHPILVSVLFGGGFLVSSTRVPASVSQPSSFITAPAPGSTVSGTVTISASVCENPIAYIQGANDLRSNASSIGAAFSGDNTAGNFIVVTARWSTTSITATISDSNGNTYLLAGNRQREPNNFQQSIWYATNISGGPNTITVSFSDAPNFSAIAIHEYSGIGATDALNLTATGDGWGTTTDAGSITTTEPNELIFAAASAGRDVAWTPEGPYALRQSNPRIASEEQIVCSVVTTSSTLRTSMPVNWIALIATFNGASASDAIAGVQFLLDGVNLGSELTSPPYALSWDTTTVADGTHTIAAVARDTAGNQTTSAEVVFSVGNATPVNPPVISRYEYVFTDGNMYVYDMDRGHQLVKNVNIPQARGIRGTIASAATHMLYISYGGDGGGNGNGSLLKLDLLTDQVVWTHDYSHGIDSMAITPDGRTIYMPSGELSSDGNWYVVDAATGAETGVISAGTGPHNTIVSLDGAHVYMGGRNFNHLEVADTATNTVIKQIGPLQSGVRPFTINGKETIGYASVTGFLGFQVLDLTAGQVLYTVPISGFSWDGTGPSDPSHGVSLSPDEKELYVIDWPDYVHVFDVSNVPSSAPVKVADIKLSKSMNHYESPCLYDCLADGWLQHSRDGRFVYVGDEGDVIDTATRQVLSGLPISATLYNARKMIEIDWLGGLPIFAATSRASMGYVK